jgi:hypothetical protein
VEPEDLHLFPLPQARQQPARLGQRQRPGLTEQPR